MGTSVTIDLNKAADFESFTYPAGETQVRFREDRWPGICAADEVTIIARIKNAQDIVTLALLSNAIDSRKFRTLVLPYLPYGRADRRFRDGDCCGLQVFGQVIGSMNLDSVITLDAHNKEGAQLFIPFLVDRPPAHFIECAIVNFARDHSYERKCINVVFPDEGARARYRIPERYAGNVSHVDTEIFHCSKHRDPVTGALLGFDVPQMPDRPTIIIDDICDGGGTFVGIGGKLRERLANPLGLYVTHGIFSKGLDVLRPNFTNVYTTDSLPQKTDSLITVYNCMRALETA